jgi:hypothetical protein
MIDNTSGFSPSIGSEALPLGGTQLDRLGKAPVKDAVDQTTAKDFEKLLKSPEEDKHGKQSVKDQPQLQDSPFRRARPASTDPQLFAEAKPEPQQQVLPVKAEDKPIAQGATKFETTSSPKEMSGVSDLPEAMPERAEKATTKSAFAAAKPEQSTAKPSVGEGQAEGKTRVKPEQPQGATSPQGLKAEDKPIAQGATKFETTSSPKEMSGVSDLPEAMPERADKATTKSAFPAAKPEQSTAKPSVGEVQAEVKSAVKPEQPQGTTSPQGLKAEDKPIAQGATKFETPSSPKEMSGASDLPEAMPERAEKATTKSELAATNPELQQQVQLPRAEDEKDYKRKFEEEKDLPLSDNGDLTRPHLSPFSALGAAQEVAEVTPVHTDAEALDAVVAAVNKELALRDLSNLKLGGKVQLPLDNSKIPNTTLELTLEGESIVLSIRSSEAAVLKFCQENLEQMAAQLQGEQKLTVRVEPALPASVPEGQPSSRDSSGRGDGRQKQAEQSSSQEDNDKDQTKG